MKIGLYGGSFDPIHLGHIEPVLEASERLGLERVVYLPTASPPHKTDRLMALAHRRFAMVELALLEYKSFQVSAFETRKHPAYTVHTVEHFLKRQPHDELFLIVGADSFCHLHSWRRGEEIIQSIKLVVLARPGWRLEDQALAAPQQWAVDAGRVQLVANAPINASSTEIRRLLQAEQAIPTPWLHPRVLDYIRKYSLYGT